MTAPANRAWVGVARAIEPGASVGRRPGDRREAFLRGQIQERAQSRGCATGCADPLGSSRAGQAGSARGG